MKYKNTCSNPHIFVALICIACGLLPVLVATGFIYPQPGSVHVPMRVLSLCGLVFVLAGLMLLNGQDSSVNDLLGAIICLCFGLTGLWVGIYGESDNFSEVYLSLTMIQTYLLRDGYLVPAE